MTAKGKTKPKKIQYRKVTLKITTRQKMMLERYCKGHKTSLVRLIKRSVREFLERNAADPADEYYISPNQLKLFDEEPEESATLFEVAEDIPVKK